jgi:hypothetical protein
MSQIATSKISKENRGGRRYTINAFTGHGILMLANVLRSKREIAGSIQIIGEFVRLRQFASINVKIAAKIKELEKTFHQNLLLFQFSGIPIPTFTSRPLILKWASSIAVSNLSFQILTVKLSTHPAEKK